MKVKRIISIMLLFAMMLTMFTGCAKDKEEDPTTSNNTTGNNEDTDETDAAVTSEATETETPEPVTLTVWVTENQQDEFDLAQEQRFAEMYPYITLNKVLIVEGMDYMTAYAAGNAPDFLSVGMPLISSYIYSGVTAPLNDYLDNWEEKDAMKMEMFDNFKVADNYYGIPGDAYVMVLNYNKKIFAEAGLQPPTTWDELVETAKALTVPEKGQWGMNLLVSQWTEWWFEYFVWMAGGDLTKENPDGTLELTFDDPAVVQAVELYRELIQGGCIQPDVTLDYGTMQSQFAAGHAAMTINGSDGADSYVSNGMSPDDIGYAPLPVGPSGEKITQMGGSVTFITNGIDQAKQDAAWKWISFINCTDERKLFYEDLNSKGKLAPALRVRTDMADIDALVNPELQALFEEASGTARLEFFGKGVVGSYVDTAVRKTVLDPSVDILASFVEQQDLAQKEAADNFNESVLSSKQ
jgi:ABC-type glycerol-3-phosphate transport system substrate-binding protein